jgi:hypothetical protein
MLLLKMLAIMSSEAQNTSEALANKVQAWPRRRTIRNREYGWFALSVTQTDDIAEGGIGIQRQYGRCDGEFRQ